MGDTKTIKMRPRRQLRQITLFAGFCLVVYCLFFVSETPASRYFSSSTEIKRPSKETLNNLSLTENECRATFPGLTQQIDEVVAQGPFKVKHSGDFGPLQGRIKDGQISIINAQRKLDLSREMVNSRTASLHQLHRAIITSPSPLPLTIFTLNIRDEPFGTAWTYSRQASPSLRPKDPNTRSFLMPHFSFWAWDLPFVGSISRASHAIAALEALHPSFSHKIPKVIWRGTSWYNSVHSPQLRQKLLQSTKNKPWADVQSLEWTTIDGQPNSRGQTPPPIRTATNALPIEDFCRYKYIIHTEGVTYSGRFQFLQMCNSVVLTPPIQWLQHTTHLVRPVFSSTLLSSSSTNNPTKKKQWKPTPRTLEAWPTQYPPSEANIVFVAPDWSDLEDTISWLEAHPKIASGIARRQRELFVGGGYFSPAAETCYWRALVKGWADMAVVERGNGTSGEGGNNDRWDEHVGVPYEMFSLTNGD